MKNARGWLSCEHTAENQAVQSYPHVGGCIDSNNNIAGTLVPSEAWIKSKGGPNELEMMNLRIKQLESKIDYILGHLCI